MAGIVFSKLSGKNDSLYKAVEGVLTEVIADAEKETNRHDEVLTAMCAMKTSDKFGERVGGRTTFGDFAPIPEGGVIVKDEIEEGFGKLVQHTAFAKGFTTTHEMAADGDVDAASAVAREFVESYKRSRLDFATAYLTTEGTTFQYGGKTFDKTTGDGVGFFSTGHLNKKNSATQSNVYTNAFGTTSDMLNRLAVIGRNFKDDSYNPTGSTQSSFRATATLLKTRLRRLSRPSRLLVRTTTTSIPRRASGNSLSTTVGKRRRELPRISSWLRKRTRTTVRFVGTREKHSTLETGLTRTPATLNGVAIADSPYSVLIGRALSSAAHSLALHFCKVMGAVYPPPTFLREVNK